jgi:hypothetical protein
MFHSMRRLGLVAAGVAAGLTLLTGASQAGVISFTSNAYSQDARDLTVSGGSTANNFYTGSGGIDVNDFFVGPVPHEAVQTSFSTSGAPYFVSSIIYDTSTASSSGVVFVNTPGGGGSPINPMPFAQGAGSSFNVSEYVGPVTAGGKVVTENFTETGPGNAGPFLEGPQNGVFTYVQINNGSTELTGTGPTDTASATDLLPFNGTKISVVFSLNSAAAAEAVTLLGPGAILTTNGMGGVTSFRLDGFYAVQTSDSGNTGDFGFHNIAQGGGSALATPIAVPEPGTLALFIGMGISGSGLLLRRRRR